MNPLSDLRFAARTALKSPGLVLAGVVALALGIGANTAVFSVADAVLFKPLNLPDARGVVVALETQPGRPDVTFGVSTADYFDWKSQSHAFEGMAAYQFWTMNLTSGGPEWPATFAGTGSTPGRLPLCTCPTRRIPSEPPTSRCAPPIPAS
jgi:putative ABC transport system permease protein